ncbi:hypothetical protein B0H13DRAFT_1867343 [Mycena leptocephala]|nr:hypothetical protein B0H13DRAFT_1867343 [Mycena leptocephala]
MFEAAGDISQGDIKAYRRFAFPPALGDPTHDPFFSVENAPDWITSRGYQLYLEHDNGNIAVGSWDTDNATPTQVRSYRNCMVGESYLHHPSFSLDNSESWISLLAFQAYMDTFHGSFNMYRTRHSTPALGLPLELAHLSQHSSRVHRAVPPLFRPLMLHLHVPQARFHSPTALLSSRTTSSPLATLAPPLMAPTLECASPLPPVAAVAPSAKKRKGKQKAGQPGIRLTCDLAVDEIVPISTIPATWTVPRIHTAYLVDLHDSQELLKVGKRMVTIDGFIRAETLLNGTDCRIRIHRVVLVVTAKTIFADCKRYEPDEEAMRALWTLELEANEREAASAPGKIVRFYVQIKLSKCKIACDGVPIIKEYLNNNGRLPGPPLILNEKCPLTVHPRIGKGLQHCPYSHIINGQIMVARIVQRKCPTEMIIFVPVEQLNPDIQKALIFLRNPHNHPAHPKTKPSANDKLTLGKAVEAAGIVGLNAQRLLNGDLNNLRPCLIPYSLITWIACFLLQP